MGLPAGNHYISPTYGSRRVIEQPITIGTWDDNVLFVEILVGIVIYVLLSVITRNESSWH